MEAHKDKELSSYHKTQNNRGYMHPLSTISKQFIEFALSHYPVIDMGCAYGNVVITALESGSKNVIACDVEQAHLDILHQNIDSIYRNKLVTVQGRFPEEFTFLENSIAAIHASHLLEYLNDKEIDQGLENFYRWLKAGGRIYLICYSVFIKELINEKFQTLYQTRLKQNLKWPGYLENYNLYANVPENSEYDSSAFPKDLQMYDVYSLVKALQKLGFKIEFADYLDGSLNSVAKEVLYDGRELVGIIATK